jgi:branched-chain amino acid transport system ATP-binding protein
MMTAAALELRDVVAGYGHATVLRNVSLTVAAGGVTALLGANGGGKTTTMRVAAGLLKPGSGQVLLNGDDVTQAPPFRRTNRGLCLIPEGRGIFRSLTVAENLRLYERGKASKESSEDAFEAFPVLRRRAAQVAGSLSGGEQQMLALARAYVSSPAVVLLDEVSMGLSPRMVDQIYEALAALAAAGMSLLIVEQYVGRALELAQEVVVLEKGRVAYSGRSSDLEADEIVRSYMGNAADAGHGPADEG